MRKIKFKSIKKGDYILLVFKNNNRGRENVVGWLSIILKKLKTEFITHEKTIDVPFQDNFLDIIKNTKKKRSFQNCSISKPYYPRTYFFYRLNKTEIEQFKLKETEHKI